MRALFSIVGLLLVLLVVLWLGKKALLSTTTTTTIPAPATQAPQDSGKLTPMQQRQQLEAEVKRALEQAQKATQERMPQEAQ